MQPINIRSMIHQCLTHYNMVVNIYGGQHATFSSVTITYRVFGLFPSLFKLLLLTIVQFIDQYSIHVVVCAGPMVVNNCSSKHTTVNYVTIVHRVFSLDALWLHS